MSRRILVAGMDAAWWMHLLRIGSILAVVLGSILKAQGNDWALLLIIAAAVVFAINEAWVFVCARNRRWVEDTGAGFEVTDRTGTRQVRDEEVIAVSYWTTDRFSNGLVAGIDRRFLCWLEGDPAPLSMTNYLNAGLGDPLGELIQRLIDRLQQEGEQALKSGRQVTGDGWSLQHGSLSILRGAMPDEFPWDRLEAIDVFDGHVCIWQQGEERASIRFPLASRNAHLLLLLLSTRLAERENKSKPPTEGLGRVLFERSGSKPMAGFLLIASLGFVIGGLLLLPTVDTGIGVAMLLIAVVLAPIGMHLWKKTFRCQDYGVYQRGLTGERSLRYLDVESFKYHAVRQFVNGGYTGTTFQLTFWPLPGSGGSVIHYSTTLKGHDESVEILRDHISRIIGARMAEQLQEQSRVDWTPNLSFVEDGLEYRPAGWIGRKEPVHIPYEEIHNFDLQEGVFHVWRTGAGKSEIFEPVSEPNFFPGYFLLCAMAAPPADEATEQQQPQAES